MSRFAHLNNISFKLYMPIRKLSSILFISIGLFFLATISLYSQSKVIIGVSGGTYQSNFMNTQSSYSLQYLDVHHSWEGGIFIKGARPNHFNMGVELNYRRKAEDMQINYVHASGSEILVGNFNLNYVSVIFLPEYRLGGKVEWFINGGPFLGSLISSTFVGDDNIYSYVGPSNLQHKISETPSRFFESNEFGIVANSGISFSFWETWHLNLNFRYLTNAIPKFQSSDYSVLLGVSKNIHIKMDRFKSLEH